MIPCTNARCVPISDIKGMEDYKEYYVDVNGDIWTTKRNNCRKLRYYEEKRNNKYYLTVQLTKGHGRKCSYYIHQLVARAFLPNHSNSWGISHKNGNDFDNRLDNLEWIGKKTDKKSNVRTTDLLVVDKNITDYIKLVHRACIEKGLKVPTTYEFFTDMLHQALDDYVNRYGLRKTIYQLERSES